MAISAWKMRSALGSLNVGIGQIRALLTGDCTNTPETQEAALAYLREAAAMLQEEAKLVEHGQTPTIREWNEKGDTVFFGSVPFAYPPAETTVITTDAIAAIEKMVK